MPLATRTEYFGLIDFRNPGHTLFDPAENVSAIGGTVEVDGRPVKLVWYADTVGGVVKTYDVLGDGRVHTTAEERFRNYRDMSLQHRAAQERWEVFPSGLLWKLVKGKVRVFGPEGV